jgi:hypothetical protein
MRAPVDMATSNNDYTREKWLRLDAREQAERGHAHALGCSHCGNELDSDSCDSYRVALFEG